MGWDQAFLNMSVGEVLDMPVLATCELLCLSSCVSASVHGC